jgi:hypothetical protein
MTPPSRPQGLRRFVRPQDEPPEQQWHPAEQTLAEAAATDLPPLVAELLSAPVAASQTRAQQPTAEERCELCHADIPPEHGHVADLENSSLACACRACYLLFTRHTAARGRYRAVPDRYLWDDQRLLTQAQFDELEIPVGLAFFMWNSRAERVIAFYPSPAGATECELDLGAWQRLAADHPLLDELQPDVEAALISRGEAGIEYFLIPIDACYELVGRMRVQWRGFDGGSEARASIAAFLETVRSSARPYPAAAPASAES